MASNRQILHAVVAMLLAAASSEALAASKLTDEAARADVRELLKLMDKDKNGTVSRDEFLQYMGQTFDRLDANANGQLESDELIPLVSANFMRCTTLASKRGLIVGESRVPNVDRTSSVWKQFMDACLSGGVR